MHILARRLSLAEPRRAATALHRGRDARLLLNATDPLYDLLYAVRTRHNRLRTLHVWTTHIMGRFGNHMSVASPAPTCTTGVV
jgi:hypothetical protein